MNTNSEPTAIYIERRMDIDVLLAQAKRFTSDRNFFDALAGQISSQEPEIPAFTTIIRGKHTAYSTGAPHWSRGQHKDAPPLYFSAKEEVGETLLLNEIPHVVIVNAIIDDPDTEESTYYFLAIPNSFFSA